MGPQAQTTNRQRVNRATSNHAGINGQAIARPRKGRIVVQPPLENDFDENEEENEEYQAAHKYKNGHLIMLLAAWAKKPSVEHDLSGTLLKFGERTLENVDFIEAALLIQAAAELYAKKVDLICKSIHESQLRIVKSYTIINVEELQKIEKKMRKRKLTQIDDQQKSKRHKKRKNWMLRPIFGEFFETIMPILENSPTTRIKEPESSDMYHMEPEDVEPMRVALNSVLKWHDPEFVRKWDEEYAKAFAARFIPLEEYIYRPFVEQSCYVAYESPDQIVHWENTLMSDHNFYHEKKFKWYEVFYNKKDPKTMLDVTVWEDAAYNHRMANLDAKDICDLLINYDKFDDTACEKFLGDRMREEYEAQIAAETIEHKIQRLCPYKAIIEINRIPQDVMQRHLDSQAASLVRHRNVQTPSIESHLNRQAASQQATLPQAQEVAENFTVLVVSEPDNPNAEQEILVLPQSTPENTESLIESSRVPVESTDKTAADFAPADNDSGIFSGSELSPQNITLNSDDDSDNGPAKINETIVEEVGTTGLTAQERRAVVVLDAKQKERCKSPIKLRERKTRKPFTNDDCEVDKPKRKKRFKLEVTTTVNFEDYERFFCSNYNAETGEGIVIPLPPPAEPQEKTPQADPPQQTATPEEGLNTEDNTAEEPTEDNTAEEPESQVTRIPKLPTGEIITPEIRRFMDIEATIAKNREDRRWYYDWESTIQAVLKEQQSSKYDIHEYGTRIVNLFPEDEPGKIIMFKDMVKEQPKKEVIRNFMAALHLATSMNLEPSGTTPGKLCNETLAFKLLNKELHHETLMEFAAPSELKGTGGRGRKKKNKIAPRKAEPTDYIIEEILDISLSYPAEKQQRVLETADREPKSLSRISKSSRARKLETAKNSHVPTLGTPVVVLNNYDVSGLTQDGNTNSRIKEIQDRLSVRQEAEELTTKTPSVLNDSASNSQNILNQTMVNTRKNKQSSSSPYQQEGLLQSQSAKTPGKRVSFSEVRCTTTIVKTPTSFLLNNPVATSTPSPRSNHLISCDSGFFTDGASTPGATPPSSKIRRLTIEEALFDVDILMAGPSKDYADYPATLDDTLSIEDGLTPTKQCGDKERERVIYSRKRQLDFGLETAEGFDQMF